MRNGEYMLPPEEGSWYQIDVGWQKANPDCKFRNPTLEFELGNLEPR